MTRFSFVGLLLIMGCTETIVQTVPAPTPEPELPTAVIIYDKPKEGDENVIMGFVRIYSDVAYIGRSVCQNGTQITTDEQPLSTTYSVHVKWITNGIVINEWDETVSQTYTFTQDTTITL